MSGSWVTCHAGAHTLKGQSHQSLQKRMFCHQTSDPLVNEWCLLLEQTIGFLRTPCLIVMAIMNRLELELALDQIKRRGVRRRRRLMVASRLIQLGAACGLIARFVFSNHAIANTSVWLCAGLFVASCFLGRRRALPVQVRQSLGSVDNDLIRSLIQLLWETDAHEHAAIRLTALLPHCTASQIGDLTQEERHQLLLVLDLSVVHPDRKLDRGDPLGRYYYADFQIAVLDLLAQIDDGSAIAVVKQLTEVKMETVRQQQVAASARCCLAALTERREQVRLRTTLIRVSDATILPDVLLRPVINRATDANELLRTEPNRLGMSSEGRSDSS